jgi:hypothetical protein
VIAQHVNGSEMSVATAVGSTRTQASRDRDGYFEAVRARSGQVCLDFTSRFMNVFVIR